MRSPNFKVVEFDHFRIGGVRRIDEAAFGRAAAIATTFQPSELYKLTSMLHATDLMTCFCHTNFYPLASGEGERRGDEGRG